MNNVPPVWSQTLAVGESPVRFEYPCPEEGAFTYVVKNDKEEVVEGPWAFIVTDIGGNENPVNLVNPVKRNVSRKEKQNE